MDIQSRLDLIRQVGEEIITEEELKVALSSTENKTKNDVIEAICQAFVKKIKQLKLDTYRIVQKKLSQKVETSKGLSVDLEVKRFPDGEVYLRILNPDGVKDAEVTGLLICESPNLEEDTLLLQETYNIL